MSVIKTDEFENRRTVAKFKRICDFIEQSTEEILKNPFNALNDVSNEICRLRGQLLEIKKAANPLPDNTAYDPTEKMSSIGSDALDRLIEIDRILEK